VLTNVAPLLQPNLESRIGSVAPDTEASSDIAMGRSMSEGGWAQSDGACRRSERVLDTPRMRTAGLPPKNLRGPLMSSFDETYQHIIVRRHTLTAGTAGSEGVDNLARSLASVGLADRRRPQALAQ
jgi:hypothetical protein